METATVTVERAAKGRQERLSVRQMLDLIDKMPPVSLEEGWCISQEIQQEARANGTAGMTMEEIDEEIAACRRERQDWLERTGG